MKSSTVLFEKFCFHEKTNKKIFVPFAKYKLITKQMHQELLFSLDIMLKMYLNCRTKNDSNMSATYIFFYAVFYVQKQNV